jgi:ABC-type transport system substrate-binding protein/tRNA A-37 threonylcarbamoyl transferase component Bud32
VVYLAEKEGAPERVAVKLLDPELARDERFRQRLLRESQLAASLTHPHVVPIVDFGEADGELYLAMRYIEGSDLRQLLAAEGPLEPERTLGILAQVADALDEAHSRGLVHRDVKPANILLERVGEEERAYLGDFGLAKHAASVNSLTGDHAFVGTLSYVSPEQVRGDEIDGRADQYSLGCVLYECLANASPFERESELAVVYAHLNERAPRLTDTRPELPEGLDEVIRAATAKSPKDRFASCSELVAAARAALTGKRLRRRRRRMLSGVAVLALLGGAAAAIVALAGGAAKSSAPDLPRLALGGPGVALVDPGRHRVAARIPLPERPDQIVFRGRSAWALLTDSQRLVRVDATSHRQTGNVRLPFVPGGVAVGGSSLYVTEKGGPGLVRIASANGKISGHWTVDTLGPEVSDPTGIAAGAGSVWLARGSQVVRVDGRTGRVQHRFPLPVTATLLTFANGALWAASSENGLVEKIDPTTDRIAARATLHGWISALAVAEGSVWASVTPDDVVFRLNEDDASVEQTVPTGGGPESISAAPGAIWVAASRGGAINRIDARSGARDVLAVTGEPYVATFHDGLVWTVAEPSPPPLAPASKGLQVRVAVHDDGMELDPAVGPNPTVSQLLYSTCAKLVNYPDAAGAAGGKLVPDAAAAMPVISPNGRTYTFRIRPGIRFSPPSKEVVSAETFRHSIERTLSPKVGPDPAGLHLAGDIVGAHEFSSGRARHVSGIVAQGNRLSITLTHPAGDLPSRLAMPMFCAVPSNTPAPGSVRGTIPSAGPYYVRSQTAAETVLDRNPNYRGARPRRPARIVYVTGVPTARAVALTGRGQIDVVTWDYDNLGPLAPGGALARRFGADPAAVKRDGSARYQVAAAPGVDMLAFNTKRALFKDPRLRRAVNYALDRKSLAAVFDEAPTDRYVPPAVPMPRTAPVYPLLRPDLASAKRLVSGTRKRTASVYVCGEPANLRIAQLVRSNLRPLGIDVSIIQSLGCLRGPDPKASQADIILLTWASAELDPAPFLEATVGRTAAFGAGPGPVTYDDQTVNGRLDRASVLGQSERLAGYARLQDDLLRGPAPYAAYGSFVAPEFFSQRIGCRLIQGAYDVLDLGAVCLRRG